jgi:hypothetical protein
MRKYRWFHRAQQASLGATALDISNLIFLTIYAPQSLLGLFFASSIRSEPNRFARTVGVALCDGNHKHSLTQCHES